MSRQFFQEKIGVTPSVAAPPAPGDTNPSDATAIGVVKVSVWDYLMGQYLGSVAL